MKATLTKIIDNKFNNEHPNGINEGYKIQGNVWAFPNIGDRCIVGDLRTSNVVDFIDGKHFNTLNSTYHFDYNDDFECVSLAIIREGDKVLAVSKKDDHTDFGLPGGKLEENEIFDKTLVRGVLEETGILCTKFKQIYSDIVDRKLIVCYEVTEWHQQNNPTEEGLIMWVEPNFLKLPQHSLHDYNQSVL